ncbi:leucyl/phenylalanyl-tRNA--protein transferase [Halotalea alkalilenta]|uniref:leucyl/phenylalanyl-tRNA--protein transferase n=1 Tax=Halotalea alkalilenta TaxID=376489 RepID=UPI000B2078A0|nr:leucyl/phenylalanyl-tRNA--protein transferase [Halotalea alkalilenta]
MTDSLIPAWLGDGPVRFPDVELSLREPDGLLAVGGRLTPEWLLAAYQRGIFPWYSPGEPLLWWSPDPRMVLYPGEFRLRRSLAKRIRNGGFTITLDHDFEAVIHACAASRSEGTWIGAEMIDAYQRLYRLGHAHSVEVWRHGELVGGLYGVALGRVFFGESMFSRVSDGSKMALALLVGFLIERGFSLIDCQMHTPHLERLGARLIPRRAFSEHLARDCATIDAGEPGSWRAILTP